MFLNKRIRVPIDVNVFFPKQCYLTGTSKGEPCITNHRALSRSRLNDEPKRITERRVRANEQRIPRKAARARRSNATHDNRKSRNTDAGNTARTKQSNASKTKRASKQDRTTMVMTKTACMIHPLTINTRVFNETFECTPIALNTPSEKELRDIKSDGGTLGFDPQWLAVLKRLGGSWCGLHF